MDSIQIIFQLIIVISWKKLPCFQTYSKSTSFAKDIMYILNYLVPKCICSEESNVVSKSDTVFNIFKWEINKN